MTTAPRRFWTNTCRTCGDGFLGRNGARYCTACRRAAPSPVLAAFDARQALEKSAPTLAALYWIEAAADRRIECDVDGLALRTAMRDRAREAIERVTRKPFHNPLYR